MTRAKAQDNPPDDTGMRLSSGRGIFRIRRCHPRIGERPSLQRRGKGNPCIAEVPVVMDRVNHQFGHPSAHSLTLDRDP